MGRQSSFISAQSKKRFTLPPSCEFCGVSHNVSRCPLDGVLRCLSIAVSWAILRRIVTWLNMPQGIIVKARMPLFYEIEYQRGASEPQSRPLVSFVDLELPELQRSDVEVAADWSNSYGYELNVQCLARNGNLYLPTISRAGRFVTPTDVLNLGRRSDAAQELYCGVITGPSRLYYLDQWLRGNDQLFPTPRGGTTVCSTEAEDTARLQFLADRTFILGNRVWQRVVGLHCEVSGLPNHHGDQLIYSDLDYSKDDGATWVRRWAPRSWDWAEEIRMSLNDVRDHQGFGDQTVSHDVHRIEIHKPDSFEFDGRAWFLDRFAKEFLEESKSHIGDWSAEDMEEWLNIRAAVEGADGFCLSDALPILEAMKERPLQRSAEFVLERGFAGWKKLEQLLEDSDPNVKQSQVLVGRSMGRD